jgi:heparan-alpha-glucosaminide N-acetyltransferase
MSAFNIGARRLVSENQRASDRIIGPSALNLPVPSRVEAIDIFRGLNVLLMIFVDNLGFVSGLAWWTYHMPPEANGMTYVDMVFPAFLFLMGMSIPLSIRSRIAKGLTFSKIGVRVVVRSLRLVMLGLFIANAPLVDARSTGISEAWWATLGFIAIGLSWIRLPGSNRHPTTFLILRYCGFGLLLALAVIFRRVTADGKIAWLDFSDWEILGLLGWAYLLVATIYLFCERTLAFKTRIAVLVSALATLVAINALSTAGRLNWIHSLPPYLQPFEAGLSSLTMAGLLVSLLIVDDRIAPTLREKARWALSSSAILFGVGWTLRPLGISKIRDTPTWCLYCMSANILVVLLLYWMADIKGWLRWARFARIPGVNPLLSYFLPYLAYLIPKLDWLTADGTAGWPGVAKSLFFTGLILALVAGLNRWKITLRI